MVGQLAVMRIGGCSWLLVVLKKLPNVFVIDDGSGNLVLFVEEKYVYPYPWNSSVGPMSGYS
jgi:hypothetical protein